MYKITLRMFYKQGPLLPLRNNLQLLSSRPPEKRGITTDNVQESNVVSNILSSRQGENKHRRIYIVEVGRQLLDVLLQLVGRLQAVLEETAEQREKVTGRTPPALGMNQQAAGDTLGELLLLQMSTMAQRTGEE